MTDTPSSSAGPNHFCGECGSAVDQGATFCGSCGAAIGISGVAASSAGPGTDAGGDAAGGAPPGASNWAGVQTVVDRGDGPMAASDPTVAMPASPPTEALTVPVPNVPPPPGPAGPPAGGPPPAGPPPGTAPAAAGAGASSDGKGNGPKIVIGLLVLAALIGGAFFLLGGDGGDDDATDTTFQRDDDGDDGDTTTSTAAGDTTTTTVAGDTTTTTAVVEAGFVNLVDDTGRITVDVPDDWTDISLAPNEGLPRILAAPDANAFETGFEVPGLDLRLLATPVAPAQFDSSLDTVANTIGLPNSCTSTGKQDYTDGVFTGRMEVWGECAGIGTQMALVFASQADGQTIFLGLQLTAADDPAIADRVSGSFLIIG